MVRPCSTIHRLCHRSLALPGLPESERLVSSPCMRSICDGSHASDAEALSMSVCVASSLSWLMMDLHRSAAPSSSTNFVQSLGASAARTARLAGGSSTSSPRSDGSARETVKRPVASLKRFATPFLPLSSGCETTPSMETRCPARSSVTPKSLPPVITTDSRGDHSCSHSTERASTPVQRRRPAEVKTSACRCDTLRQRPSKTLPVYSSRRTTAAIITSSCGLST
mmetsp:Transcript_4916/g.15697  ORF Transcript_4916/g.15697 Transcript_4916/m.15697 type:complete len:225 (+) Transcript_4916:210-884(+)